MRLVVFFPRFKTFSGAEHFILDLLGRLVEAGLDVEILTRRFDDTCRAHMDPRIRVRIPALASRLVGHQLVDSLLDTLFSPLLLPLLRRGDDPVCFVCSPVLPAMWMLRRLLRRRNGIAYYCFQPPRFAYDLSRDTTTDHALLGRLAPWIAAPYRWLDRHAARYCDLFLALSSEYAQWCREIYDPPDLRIIYPGFDPAATARAQPARARSTFGLSADVPVVTTVGKLVPQKRVDLFLRALKTVRERVPNCRGVVVGDGPSQARLLRMRRELELEEHVIFTGFVPRFEDVVDLYAASSVYVYLEHNVPFGMTIPEAGACGTPAVAVRAGGAIETVIDGETGFLVHPDATVEEIADRICWLLENDDERRVMGERAAKHARRFTIDASAAAFLSAVGGLATPGHSAPITASAGDPR